MRILENNIEIYCNDDLRRSAFGQSYVRTCPIYLAALGREAVFGDMVKPFVIKNIVDTSDFSNVIGEGSEPFEVIGSIPKEYRQNLLDGMSGVASNLGVYVPEGYQLYAKTGTAETGEGQKPNAMFSGFVTDSSYPLAFIICVENGGYGSEVCVPIASSVLSVCKQVMDQG